MSNLSVAFDKINKDFGEGAIQRLGDEAQAIEAISTGSIALDQALGIGGVPRGRVVEIFGPESSGKTTVALHVLANAQKAGSTVAFIDAEHALDPKYAGNLGVNTNDLLVSQPSTAEQALGIVDRLVRTGEVGVIVVDSVAALAPRAEIEGDMGDAHIGLQARLMGQALRKLTGVTSETNTTLIFINQLRFKVGMFFGSPEVTPGGKALPFYSSVRMDVRKIETLKQKDEAIGARTRVKVVKNKVAPPFKTAEFEIRWGTGISREAELIDLGIQHGIVHKAGSWLSIPDDNGDKMPLGQGKEQARQALIDEPGVADVIETRIRELLATPF